MRRSTTAVGVGLSAVLQAALAALVAAQATQAPVPAAAAAGFPGQYAPPPAERKFPAWPKGCARATRSDAIVM